MSLPSKKAIKVDEHTTDYEYKMLNHEMALRYKDDACVECGFCHRVCPTTFNLEGEPIKKTAIGKPKDMDVDSDQKIVVDLDKCIWCGLCSYICPGYALELRINNEPKLLLVENESLPEFKEEKRTLDDGNEVRKVVQGSITIKSEEKDKDILEQFADECSVNALSVEDKEIIVDREKCILCYKCSEAAENYENVEVTVHRDRFMEVKGEPGSVWNGLLERVLGVEGKIKGIKSYRQNKLVDSMMRLLGEKEPTEEKS
jgi:ferredoxin